MNSNVSDSKRRIGALSVGLLICLLCPALVSAGDDLPNVVIVYADDLGFGDVSCLNDRSKIATPNIDALAKSGLSFTDAHSAATVCTPSRYSLLTGRYAFRLPNHGRVFDGVGGPNLIDKDRLSLAQMFSNKGYATACYGKWHVGMTFYDKEGNPINKGGPQPISRIDFSKPITGSPIHRGFDHFFGTAACPTTDWLYAYVDGDRVTVPPDTTDQGRLDKSTLPNHVYSRDNRRGWKADDFDLESVDLVFLQKSEAFLEQHCKQSPDRPFFLYLATQAVHLPSFPANEFKGKTEAGPHGDFIHELDVIVGRLIDKLQQLEEYDNTIIIFTSDNGPEVLTAVNMRKDYDHDGARPWRGIKRDVWEGGHRVPMMVAWPGKIAAGRQTDQLFCQTDIMATLATIIDYKLPNNAAEDSFDFSSLWLGEVETPIRNSIIHQGFAGDRKLGYRSGKWKLMDFQGSGGNNYEKSKPLKPYQLPNTAPDAAGQLYDLSTDPGEKNNRYLDYPKVVAKLAAELKRAKESGRTVPARSSN